MSFELILGLIIAAIMAGCAIYLLRKWGRWKKETDEMFETKARFFDGR